MESALEKDINGLDWMTPPTKKEALVKTARDRRQIGYPDRWRDYSALTNRPRRTRSAIRSAAMPSSSTADGQDQQPVDKSLWR